jgi:hypothetical protein
MGKEPLGKRPGDQKGEHQPAYVDLDIESKQTEKLDRFTKHVFTSVSILLP